MLYKDKLQIAGSKSYLSTIASSSQKIITNDSIKWSTNCIDYQLEHIQGKDHAIIEKTGLYDIFVDVITDEPAQLTLFVNNSPDNSTIFGRDSGANRCLMRQFVKFNKGDILTIRNWESNSGTINSAENAGGHQVGVNCIWTMFMLDPDCAMHVSPCHNSKPCHNPKPCNNSKP